jgi:phenylalanyl-tRNA synthetase beta subunit
MEYSLNQLHKLTNVKELTVTEFINSLNLIGLEVDEIYQEKMNFSYEIIHFLLKIPSNREDLFLETAFLKEISFLFYVELLQHWKKIKKKYTFLRKQKYLEYQFYPITFLDSNFSEMISYFLEISLPIKKELPFWLKEKSRKIKETTNFTLFEKYFNFCIFEWGEICQFSPKLFPNLDFLSNYQINYLNSDTILLDSLRKSYKIPKGTVILTNNMNELISVLGNFLIIEKESENQKLHLEFLFVPKISHSLFFDSFQSKFSFKKFRKLFWHNFKFSFQRFLTLLEIVFSQSIQIQKYRNSKRGRVLKTTRIITLRKIIIQKILNLQSIQENLFEKAGLKIICQTSTLFYFLLPPLRRDIEREIDIIEEYSRFLGYKNFLPIFPKTIKNSSKRNVSISSFLKQFFLNYGFVEIQTNPFTDCSRKKERSIFISNPLNQELSLLRTSLFPKLIDTYQINLRSTIQVTNFFELSRVFQKKSNFFIEEEKFVAIFQFPIFSSEKNQINWFRSLGFIENLLTSLGYVKICKRILDSSFFHAKRSIFFYEKNKQIARFGQIDPKLLSTTAGQQITYLFEFNCNHFHESNFYSKPKTIFDSSKFPVIKKDLSFTVQKTTQFSFLKEFILKNCTLLKSVSFFDIYFPEISCENINLGIRFEFQSFLTTLTNEFIDEELRKIQNLLEKESNLNIRTII